MATGFLNLAYLAELAFIVNLAYLELKSLRYVKDAREIMDRVKLGLNDAKKKDGVTQEQFAELYLQARHMFGDDSVLRKSAWYVVLPNGTKRHHQHCAGLLFPIFLTERDRVISTILLVGDALVIFGITLLSQYAVDWAATPDAHTLWTTFMGFLAISILTPTAFILIGRKIKKVSEAISMDIKTRKDKSASEILEGQLNAQQLGNHVA